MFLHQNYAARKVVLSFYIRLKPLIIWEENLDVFLVKLSQSIIKFDIEDQVFIDNNL